MSAIVSHSPCFVANRTLGMGWVARNSRHAFNVIRSWRARMRQRNELLMLNAVELRDLSLTEADVNREASKPFWASNDISGR